MPEIISETRYLSLSKKALQQYLFLKGKFPEDKNFKKIGRSIRSLKGLYRRDKVYAVKHLNYLERYQASFDEERRALIVQVVVLLQKLILHKKLQKPSVSKSKKS